MKRFICMFLTAVMALGLFGCADGGSKHGRNDSGKAAKISIEDIKENDGVMLEIVCTPRLPMPEDEFRKSYIYVDYSGRTYDPDQGISALLKDKDLMTIYEFCVDAYENNTFDGYNEEVCDGVTYEFTFFDTDGEAHVIFEDAYCYNNLKIQKIFNVLGKYSYD